MYEVIDKLAPNYERRMEFTRIVMSLQPHAPEVSEWDISKLKRFHGEASRFLHFHGVPEDTFQRPTWMEESTAKLERIAVYLWEQMAPGKVTANMRPEAMQPETRAVWERFVAGEINADSAKTQLQFAHPVLAQRRINR